MCGHRRDRRFQRGFLKKDVWSCCGRASRELSLIRIVSTLLPGLQRTFCPCDGYLSLSIASSLTGANYLKTQNKILGSRKDVLLLRPFPGHLLRAAPTPPCSPPLSQAHRSWQNCRGCFCFPSRDTKLWFFSCAEAAAAVLPCRHLVAMTYEVVDVPERESINLTGTRLSTYIPC